MTQSILLIDDSKLALRMVRRVVEAGLPGWNIIEASSGEEALDVAARENIDAATIDFNMRGMDGLETAERLRAIRPAAKLALVTANVQDAIRKRADDLGISFIAKPVTDAAASQFLLALR